MATNSPISSIALHATPVDSRFEASLESSTLPPYDPNSREQREAYVKRVMVAVDRFNELPILSDRDSDEILGYNEHGVFD